jgi:drug/metabolite transporter (DMT)-like permease
MSNESKSSRYERSFLSSPLAIQSETTLPIRKPVAHGWIYGLMLLTTLLWGANPVAGKEALTGFGPVALAQLRLLGAALAYVAIFLLWPRRPRLRLRLGEWLFLAVVAALGAAFNQLFFVMGLSRSTVVHTGMISSTGPVVVLLISCLMGLESLTVPKLAGMLISFGGVALLTVGIASRSDGGHWSGDILLLAGTMTFSCYTILVKKISDRYDTLTLNTLTFGLGALLMLPFGVPAMSGIRWATLSTSAWSGLAYMIVFGSVVPYLIFAFALTELTASRVSAFTYLTPLITAALGAWWLAEKLTSRTVLCGVIILAGVYLTERARENGQPARGAAITTPL